MSNETMTNSPNPHEAAQHFRIIDALQSRATMNLEIDEAEELSRARKYFHDLHTARLRGEAAQGEQQAVAWVVSDSGGVMSFASKREHTAPFCDDPAYTVRPLVYGDRPQPVAVAPINPAQVDSRFTGAGNTMRLLIRDLRDAERAADLVGLTEAAFIHRRAADALSAAPAAPAGDPADELDFEPDEHHTIADMANVGYSLMQAIKSNCPDYCWGESPAEIVVDLINQRDEAAGIVPGGAAAPAPVAGDAVDGWQYLASNWLEEQAEEQEKTNAEYPRHAAAYKEWRDRPLALRMLAEKVKKAEGTFKRHCPPPSWMFPDDGGAVSKLPESWVGMAQDLRASVGGTHKAIAREECARELRAALAQDRASQAGAAGVPEGWRPIAEAPTGKLCIVGWLDDRDPDSPERHDFDFIEDGRWVRHDENVEHAESCAPPGSVMPPREAPYQWFIAIPEMASAPTPAAEQEVQ